jgi:hypothetical protein
MLTTKAWLFITLGGFGAFYIITWVAAPSRERSSEPIAPTPLLGAIGFVTTFFDTLGIGSFDGIVRVPDAGRQRPVHPQRQL